jgi:hypothetical protein
MKLGTLLVKSAIIGQAQLDTALRNQVLYGARLGTNLVELGFIDLNDLSAALEELTTFTAATPAHLDSAPAELLARLGAAFAVDHGTVPIGYAGGSATVVAALIDPFNSPLVKEVEDQLMAPLVPYIVPELRAMYYLEHHYGLPRRPRYLRSRPRELTESPTENGGHDRRRAQAAGGIVIPAALRVEPRHRRSIAPNNVRSHHDHAPIESSNINDVLLQISDAKQRDELSTGLQHYQSPQCDVFIAFMVRDGHAIGWCGHIFENTNAVASITLPLGVASTLQQSHDSQISFVGRPLAPHPVETDLFRQQTAAVPANHVVNAETVEIAVVPVVVKHRVVNLLYAQSQPGISLGPAAVGEMTQIANHLTNSYLRLLREIHNM